MNKILLIEPDKLLADSYKTFLENFDKYEVIVVRGAQEAISAADYSTPDIVIMELQLIEHSGIEFLYEFRSYVEWQSIPVIVQSLVPFNEFRDNWKILKNELGVEHYLYKPQTDLKSLLQSVESLSLLKT